MARPNNLHARLLRIQEALCKLADKADRLCRKSERLRKESQLLIQESQEIREEWEKRQGAIVANVNGLVFTRDDESDRGHKSVAMHQR